MESHKIQRINELSRLSRERELTQAEKEERARLRSDYLAAFRNNFKQQLAQTVVEYPDGTKTTLDHIKDKKK